MKQANTSIICTWVWNIIISTVHLAIPSENYTTKRLLIPDEDNFKPIFIPNYPFLTQRSVVDDTTKEIYQLNHSMLQHQLAIYVSNQISIDVLTLLTLRLWSRSNTTTCQDSFNQQNCEAEMLLNKFNRRITIIRIIYSNSPIVARYCKYWNFGYNWKVNDSRFLEKWLHICYMLG